MAHASRIVIKDRFETGQPVADREQLVNLFLVLAKGKANLGMLEHQAHLGGDRVLVDRNRDAAETLCRSDCPVEPRPVVADGGELVAPLEPERGKTAGERGNAVLELLPVPAVKRPPPRANPFVFNARSAVGKASPASRSSRRRRGG